MSSVIRGKIAENILELVGNTPMVRLRRVADSSIGTVLAKLEFFNPGGSIKDRICLAMIEDAEARGVLKPGATIIEPTSGNTGIGLAMVGAVKGYRVVLTMPEVMSAERLFLLKTYGAEVVLTPADEGMIGAVKKAQELVESTPGAFMPQQFQNPSNPEMHRRTTAQEILRCTDGEFDVFVAGVGTGGTVTGVGEILKRKNPKLRVVAVEPKGSPMLSRGEPGPHLIQGIGAGFIPDVLNRSIIDDIITVSDEDAHGFASRLAREEGISVGLSSGAACCAAVQLAKQLGVGKTVVTVFPDAGDRYFSAQAYFE